MTSRKAVELTLNTIIVAIIVLLVLALLAFLVIKNFGVWESGTACFEHQGACQKDPCPPGKEIVVPGKNLCGDPQSGIVEHCCSIA